MKLVIIEDEQHNVRMLQGMVGKLRPDWDVVHVFDSVASSVEGLRAFQPDLILMDIQLVDGICFSIFDQVKVDSKVIFTTAYDNYAIQAFKVNSVDYLLKPIKEEELEQAFEKFENQNVKLEAVVDYAMLAQQIQQSGKKYRTRFLISGAKDYTKLDVRDIAYFYAENKLTFAVTHAAKEQIIDETLEKLEEELNPDEFFRLNRQILVHVDSIVRFEDYFGGKLAVKLHPKFKDSVTVSRLKASAFKHWMGK
jgi:DNA-binding LytR/AlgR family response regulator